MESALYGAYALIFVLEISVNNLYVNTVRPDFHQVYIYFRFVKGRCHLTQTMPPRGNQALVMIDVILYTLVFPGSSYKKANTFLNSFRDNDVAAQV